MDIAASQTNAVERLDFRYSDSPRLRINEEVELYLERRGTGPVIIVLNNFFIASPVWRSFTSRLEGSHTIVSYDFRGQGGSSGDATRATWDDHLSDLVTVIKKQDVDKVYLLGSSISTILCKDYALRYPGKVSGIIMAGAAMSPWGTRRHRRILKNWLKILQTSGMEALFEQMFPIVFGGSMIEAMGTPGYLALRESFLVLHTQEQIEANLQVSLTSNSDPNTLRDIQAPVLLLTGDDDFAWSPSAVEAMGALVPNMTAVEVPFAGHLPFFEATESFEYAIAQFIQSVEMQHG